MEWNNNYYVNPVELLRFLKGNRSGSFTSTGIEGKSNYDGALVPRNVDGNINIYQDAFTGDDVINAIKKMLASPEGLNVIIFLTTTSSESTNNFKPSASRASTLSSSSGSNNNSYNQPSYTPNDVYDFKEDDIIKIASIAIGCGIIKRIRRGVEFVSRLRNRSYSLGTSDQDKSLLNDVFVNQEQFKPGSSRFYRYGSEDHFKYALFVTAISCSGLYSNRTKGIVHPVCKIIWRTPSGTAVSISTTKKATSKGSCEWNESFIFFIEPHHVEFDVAEPTSKLQKKKTGYGLPFRSKPLKETHLSYPHLEFSILDHFHIRDHEIAEHTIIPATSFEQNLSADFVNSEESINTLLLPLTIFDEHTGYNMFGTTTKTKSKHDMAIKLNVKIILSGYPSTIVPPIPLTEIKDIIKEEQEEFQEKNDEVDDISHDDQNSQVSDIEDDLVNADIHIEAHNASSSLNKSEEKDGNEIKKRASDPSKPNYEQSNVSNKYVSFVTSSEDAGTGVVSHGYVQLLKNTVKNLVNVEKKIEEAIKMYGEGFPFLHPKLAFEIIASSDSSKLLSEIIIAPNRPEIPRRKDPQLIQFGSFEIVAPLLPGVVHRLSAPVVHSALAMITMGEKAARDAVMRRTHVYTSFRVFHEYVIQSTAIWERVSAIDHKYAQKLLKYEQRGLKTVHRSGERVLFLQEYVRGAIDGKTSLVSLGNLYITSHTILYVRETLMGHSEAAQFDLTRAFRVSPSDGHTMFGLIILFSAERNSTLGKDDNGRRASSLLQSGSGENTSCVFRFHSKSARDLTLKIIQEVIGFQMYLRSFLMPLLQALNAPSNVRDRAIELSVDALLSDIVSVQAIRLVANAHVTKNKGAHEKARDVIAKKFLGETSDNDPISPSFPPEKPKDTVSPKNLRFSDLNKDLGDQEVAILGAAENDLDDDDNNGSNSDDNNAEEEESDSYKGIIMPDIFYKMLRAKKRGDVTSISGLVEYISNENADNSAQTNDNSEQTELLTNSKHTSGALALRSFSSFCVLSAYRERGVSLPWENEPLPTGEKSSSLHSFIRSGNGSTTSYPASPSSGMRERLFSWFEQDVIGESSDDLFDFDDQDSDGEVANNQSSNLSRYASVASITVNYDELKEELQLGESALHLTRWVRKWFLEFVQRKLESDIRARAKLQSLSQNVALFKKLIEPIHEALNESKKSWDELIAWEIPIFSVTAMVALLAIIYADLIWYIPSFLVFLFVYHILRVQNLRKKNQLREVTIPARPKRSLMEKYQRVKHAYITSKNVLYRVNLMLLKIRGLLTSENPKVTSILITALIALGFILMLVPGKFFQYAFVVYSFTSKIKRKKSSKHRMKRLLLKYWAAIPSSRLLLPTSPAPINQSKQATFARAVSRKKTKSDG